MVATQNPEAQSWKEGFFCWVICVAKQGNITEKKLKKILESTEGPGSGTISSENISELWEKLTRYYMDDTNGLTWAADMLQTVDQILGQDDCIALVNVGTFAAFAGLSSFSIIAKAIREVPTFPWMEIIPGLHQAPKKIAVTINGVIEIKDAPSGQNVLLTDDGQISAERMGLERMGLGGSLNKLMTEGELDCLRSAL